MTILKTDLRLRASQRMTDDADGGGAMVAAPLGNAFDAVSESDRLAGRLSLRKAWASVENASAEPLLGAALVLGPTDADADVSVLAFRSAAWDESAGLAETRAEVVGQMTPDSAGWFGAVPLTVAADLGDTQVQVAGPRVQVIPSTVSTTAQSGVLTLSDTMSAQHPLQLQARVASEFPLCWSGITGVLSLGESVARATAIPRDRLTATHTWVSSGTNVRVITLPQAPALGSLRVTWTGTDSVEHTMADSGAGLAGPNGSTGGVGAGSDRVVLVLSPPPANGGTVELEFAAWDEFDNGQVLGCYVDGAGVFRNAAAAEILVPGIERAVIFDAQGTGTYPSASSGFTDLASTEYDLLRAWRVDEYGAIWRVSTANGQDVAIVGVYDRVTGRFDFAGETSPPYGVAVAPEPPSISLHGAPQVVRSASLAYVTVTGPAGSATAQAFERLLPTQLTPESLAFEWSGGSATTNAAGVVSGTGLTGQYLPQTGALLLAFSAPFAGALSWEATRTAWAVINDPAVHSLSVSAWPEDGKAAVLRAGGVVVLHNTVAMSPATLTNGQTVTCGRTGLALIRVVGSDGAEITSGYTEDLAAGTLTVTSTAGWAQPVTVHHRVQDSALLRSITADGLATLSRPLSRAYGTAGTWLASAVPLGDRRAVVHDAFALETWAGDWSSTAPAPSDAAYDDAGSPIVSTNAGAVADEWALWFTSTTAFQIVSKARGVIGSGNTGAVCAPVNPATGAAYFALQPTGWGTGWSAGNVLRFRTSGPGAPLWLARCVNPSEPAGAAQSVTLTLQGSI